MGCGCPRPWGILGWLGVVLGLESRWIVAVGCGECKESFDVTISNESNFAARMIAPRGLRLLRRYIPLSGNLFPAPGILLLRCTETVPTTYCGLARPINHKGVYPMLRKSLAIIALSATGALPALAGSPQPEAIISALESAYNVPKI